MRGEATNRFNSIAVTIMKKALSRTLDRIYIASSTTSPYHPMKRPSIKTLELIIAHSNGDIRSALMSLQFLASHPDQRSGASTIGAGVIEKKGKGKKRKKGGSDEEDGEQEDMGINKLFVAIFLHLLFPFALAKGGGLKGFLDCEQIICRHGKRKFSLHFPRSRQSLVLETYVFLALLFYLIFYYLADSESENYQDGM